MKKPKIDIDTLKNYLGDLGFLLKEQALEAKQDKHKQQDELERAYYAGYLMAMHSVISLLQQQANSFGISRNLLRLDDIEPERDLL